jgi:multidrug efflux system outer membrane protein
MLRPPPAPLLLLASAAFGLLVAGCTVGADYRRPAVPGTTAYKLAPDAAPAPFLPGNWWTLFGDPDLTRLAEQAMRDSQDIKAAIARLDEARAVTQSARAGYYPSVSLDPSARRSRSPGSGNFPGNTSNNFSLPLDLSYEVDLWGQIRREYENAKNLEAASADDLEFVRQTTLADLAQDYFTLRAYDSESVILADTIKLYNDQLVLTQKKFATGLSAKTDVLTVQNQIDSANNQLLENLRSRAKEEHALAILLGLPPAGFTLESKSVAVAVPEVPPGLPPALLSRRPDVAEAEHQLIAANALVGVAQSDLYPTLSLTGSAGFQSVNLSSLVNWPSRVWSLSPGLSLPIFEGGKLNAAVAQARATYEVQVAAYRTAVLTAYQDVEDELSDLHFLQLEADALDHTLANAKENRALIVVQYQQGISSSLDLITADQTELTTRLNVENTRNQRLAASVLLIKALGGGWTPPVEQAGK